MKVIMDRDGTIEIRPETQVENYALTKWLEEYEDDKVILRISRWLSDTAFSKDHITGGTVESHVEMSRHPAPLQNRTVGDQS
jgi:hypothetical protein